MSEDLLPRIIRRESLGSTGSHESGDSAVDLHPTSTVPVSPVGALNPDTERLHDENPNQQGSADSASARYRLDRQHERVREVREASEHLERCHFYAENDTEMSAEEAAKLSEFVRRSTSARNKRASSALISVSFSA
jgi:hypothetical protein